MTNKDLTLLTDRLRVEQSNFVNKKFGIGGIRLLAILLGTKEISKEDYDKMYKPVLFFDVKYDITAEIEILE